MSLKNKIEIEVKSLNISLFKSVFLMSFPIALILIFSVLIYSDYSREFTVNLLKENNLVENLTFIFLFISSIQSLKLFFITRKTNESNLISLFLLFFSLLLLAVAMEEIAWGQHFFRWRTPSLLLKYNVQKELTFHNIQGLQGKSEIFRILFGIIGVVGLYIKNKQNYRLLSVPYVLSSFVLTILIISIFDLSDDYFAISKEIKLGTHLLSELIEMLIGLFSMLYLIYLKKVINTQKVNKSHIRPSKKDKYQI